MLDPDHEPAPADVVPMHSADLSPGDQVGDVLIPGAFLTDADGRPLGMEPNEHLRDATVTESGGVVGWVD